MNVFKRNRRNKPTSSRTALRDVSARELSAVTGGATLYDSTSGTSVTRDSYTCPHCDSDGLVPPGIYIPPGI